MLNHYEYDSVILIVLENAIKVEGGHFRDHWSAIDYLPFIPNYLIVIEGFFQIHGYYW